MKIIVHGTNWIGDAVMTLPALTILRRSIADAEITLYSRPWAKGIFKNVESFDEIVTPPVDAGIFEQARLWKAGDYDAVLLLTNSFRTALLARTAGIRIRVGYKGEGRGMLLTHAFQKPDWKGKRHEIDYYTNLVAHFCGSLGIEVADKSSESPVIPVSEYDLTEASELIRSRSGKGNLIIGLGAGSQNSAAKRWPAESFSRLAELISKQLNATIVLLGSPSEKSVADEIVATSNVVDLVGRTELEVVPSILGACDLFVSNDMGLAHIASAVGTRTITIFGPTNPVTTAPFGSEVIRRSDVECAPCMLRDCPIDHRCMTRIRPKDVFERIVETIGNG